MQKGRKSIQLTLFIFTQVAISTLAIIVFQQTFHLGWKVIVGHMIVVCVVHLLIINLGTLLFTKRLYNYQGTSRFVLSFCYGAYAVILYYVYVAAFLGKSYSSRAFTAKIVFGYLKYFNELVNVFSVTYTFIYSALVFIPLLIFICVFFQSKLIWRRDMTVNRFSQQNIFNSQRKFTVPGLVVIMLGTGLVILVGIANRIVILDTLFRMEEPIVSIVYGSDNPFQGQTILVNNEDIRVRTEYPRNIDFQKKNIIVIVVDALRADHLSLFGYNRKTSPFLDSLYSSGSLKKVEQSFAVAAASFAGINGILRSKIWSNMGYNNFSLQQLLKDQGYRINFFLSGDHTNFYGLKSFYGKNSDFDYYIDGSETKRYIVNDDRLIFEGLENIKNYSGKPSYFHFHLNSAHYAGVKLDEYKMFEPASPGVKDVENYTNRYDNGVRQADSYLRQIFQTMSHKGYLGNSIVVITADHGEALGERGQFGHVKNVYTDQILIPMLIYDTESVQYKNMRLATSLDIAPTIIDRLGLPVPKSWEGSSLFSQPGHEFSFHQMGEDYAIIDNGNRKLFKYVFNSKTKKEELFELKGDLYERKNLIDSADVQYVNFMRSKLVNFRLDTTMIKSVY
jgi:glucan phosphoethanolaminetransferase (alkaline phosphatase superfamily)